MSRLGLPQTLDLSHARAAYAVARSGARAGVGRFQATWGSVLFLEDRSV